MRSMFTQGHYKAVAKVLYDSHQGKINDEVKFGMEVVAVNLCKMFEDDNPNFDRRSSGRPCITGRVCDGGQVQDGVQEPEKPK
jgi:hypothetical protein